MGDYDGGDDLVGTSQMIPDDKMHIDALLSLEQMGLTNWADRAQLDNYRRVYPEYFASGENPLPSRGPI